MKKLVCSEFYHIFNHSNENQKLFRENDNYKYFKNQVVKYISPVADIFSYALFPNHFHLLIRTKSEEEIVARGTNLKTSVVPGTSEVLSLAEKKLANSFKNLFISYTKAMHKKYGIAGSILRPKFRRKQIEDNDYLLTLIL